MNSLPNNMSRFEELLKSHEDWLMKRLVYHAKRVIDIGDGASVEEAWRRCVKGLSGALIKGLKTVYPDFEFREGEDFRHDPVCRFMVNTAARHRERGISLAMFQALMVYYKQAWLDLVNYAEFEKEFEAECLQYTARMFDRMMVAICAEWLATDESKLIEELQSRNRTMSREKDRYLTIFEGVPNPVFILDEENHIADMNLAASVMLDISATQGAQYYLKTVTLASDSLADSELKEDDSKVFIGKTVFEVFPWLEHDLGQFTAGSEASITIEKKIPNQEETRYFNVKISRILDLREIFSGVIIILEDITAQKHAAEKLAEAYAKLSKALDALWGEMELAKKIQTALLPPIKDDIHPDFEIAASMLPAEEVGGDFYDITYDRNGNLWFAIGDVSGHGVTPGLIMMMANTVHATVTSNLNCEACDAVIKLNEILYRNVHDRLKETHFMTLTALKYLGDGKFQHAGAHISMVLWRENTGKCELIRTRGVYLNFKKDISRSTKNDEFQMEPGDILILYTDGLTEAKNPEGEMLDINRFIDIVETYAHHPPEVMKESIVNRALDWCHNTRDDDMTLLIVKRKES